MGAHKLHTPQERQDTGGDDDVDPQMPLDSIRLWVVHEQQAVQALFAKV